MAEAKQVPFGLNAAIGIPTFLCQEMKMSRIWARGVRQQPEFQRPLVLPSWSLSSASWFALYGYLSAQACRSQHGG